MKTFLSSGIFEIEKKIRKYNLSSQNLSEFLNIVEGIHIIKFDSVKFSISIPDTVQESENVYSENVSSTIPHAKCNLIDILDGNTVELISKNSFDLLITLSAENRRIDTTRKAVHSGVDKKKNKTGSWILLLVNKNNSEILIMKRIGDIQQSKEISISLAPHFKIINSCSATASADNIYNCNNMEFVIHVLSDSFDGACSQFNFTVIKI